MCSQRPNPSWKRRGGRAWRPTPPYNTRSRNKSLPRWALEGRTLRGVSFGLAPGGSFHSLRRVSSLDNFEAARSEFQRKFRERRANSGRGKTPEFSVLLRWGAMAPGATGTSWGGGEVSCPALFFPLQNGDELGFSTSNPLLSMCFPT